MTVAASATPWASTPVVRSSDGDNALGGATAVPGVAPAKAGCCWADCGCW